MITYDDTLRYLPMILRRLRLRAGHKQQKSALAAIRRKTGTRISAARMSEWEAGRTAPSLRSLFAFLLGLGYDLTTLQYEVERLVATDVPVPAPRVGESPQQRVARERAEYQRRLAGLDEQQRKLDKVDR